MQIKLRLITRNVTFVWSDLSFSPLLDECVFWETKLHPKFCPSFSEWQQSGHLHNPVWKYFNKNWSCEEEQLQEQNGPMCQKAQKGADTRKVLNFFITTVDWRLLSPSSFPLKEWSFFFLPKKKIGKIVQKVTNVGKMTQFRTSSVGLDSIMVPYSKLTRTRVKNSCAGSTQKETATQCCLKCSWALLYSLLSSRGQKDNTDWIF